MNNNRLNFDDDDYFEKTRMSFGDHIEDLRTHLIRALIGFGIGVVLAFFVAWPILEFIQAPVKVALKEFHRKREIKLVEKLQREETAEAKAALAPRPMGVAFDANELQKLIGKELPADSVDEGKVELKVVMRPLDVWKISGDIRNYDRGRLIVLRIEEAIMVYFKVAIVTGLVISSPWVFYQIWAFVAAGLYPHEKKLVNVYLPMSIALFIFGVVFCEIFVIPRAIEALLWFNDWLNTDPELRLNDWLSFAIIVPLLSGVSFQTPLVMMFLERIGVGTVELYQQFRKYAYFGMAVAAAVFSPTPDAYTMLFLWVPMCLFYEAGIFLCWMFPSKPLFSLDLPDPEEMVEV